MPRPMRIKRITIAVPRRLFDLALVWVSDEGVSGVVIGGVLGVGVVISGDGLRGVPSGTVIRLGCAAGAISAGAKGTTISTCPLKDCGRTPTPHPVPVVSQ